MAALVSRLSGRSYRLVASLARGGMGEVFVAHEVGPKAPARPVPVAIKTLLPEVVGDPAMLARFLDEATLSARLDHPNIARLVDFGEQLGRPFAAFELLDGSDLAECLQALQRKGKLPPVEVALAVVAEVCAGLHHAHTLRRDGVPMQVVHRDLSPSNLFVTVDGRAKVLDFGAATGRFRITQTAMGMIIGKLEYMAPEQIRGETLDARTDVYALGLCLFEALTLQRALGAMNQSERVRKVANAAVPDLSEVRPGLPPGVVAALQQATAADPDARFGSARELATALQAELAGLTSSSPREILGRFHQSCFGTVHRAAREARLSRLMAAPIPGPEVPFTWSAPPIDEAAEGDTLISATQPGNTRRDRPAEANTDRALHPPQPTPVMAAPAIPISDSTPAPLPAPALEDEDEDEDNRVESVAVPRPRRLMGVVLVAAVLLAAAAVGVALGHAGSTLSP
jgi:serine/threonine protein kinase